MYEGNAQTWRYLSLFSRVTVPEVVKKQLLLESKCYCTHSTLCYDFADSTKIGSEESFNLLFYKVHVYNN